VLGIAIGSLLSGVAMRSMRLVIPSDPYDPADRPVRTPAPAPDDYDPYHDR
jgi:hypothetical protein